jgi:FkbM family methyltransferase
MERIKKFIKKLPILPTVYRTIRDKRSANRKAVMTPFGFNMIGSDLMQRGEFEPAETKIFAKLIEDVDVVIDAGAHIGYYCLQALHAGKHLIAFEPMPSNLAVLLRNISLNGWQDRAEVFSLALSDKPGILEFYGGGTGASLVKGWAGFSSKSAMLVPVSSLDTVIGNRLSGKNVFILVDVEGAEYLLLQGAHQLLASEPKPIWMIELVFSANQPAGRSHNPHYLDTLNLFWDAGYEVYGLDHSGRPRLLERDFFADPAAAERQVAYNFVFIHTTAYEARRKLLAFS